MRESRKFSNFQIRWKEKLCHGDTPYLYRWTFIFFGYSIRIHHWIGDDVGPHFHDHASNFISFLFWGSYINTTPVKGDGVLETPIKAPAIWYSKAEARHRLLIGPKGAWTILFCGRPYRKWGFWVNNHLWRPLRYFSKYGTRKENEES